MSATIGREANIPNPALAPFRPLIGIWKTTGRHPFFPDAALHGRTSFEWMEGGAFLMMRSEIDEPQIPSGIALIGSDDTTGAFSMLYFDERGVSRHYEVSVGDGVVSWSRNTPEFSQRFVCTPSADGRSMTGKGEMSRDGQPWEKDLELSYTRED